MATRRSPNCAQARCSVSATKFVRQRLRAPLAGVRRQRQRAIVLAVLRCRSHLRVPAQARPPRTPGADPVDLRQRGDPQRYRGYRAAPSGHVVQDSFPAQGPSGSHALHGLRPLDAHAAAADRGRRKAAASEHGHRSDGPRSLPVRLRGGGQARRRARVLRAPHELPDRRSAPGDPRRCQCRPSQVSQNTAAPDPEEPTRGGASDDEGANRGCADLRQVGGQMGRASDADQERAAQGGIVAHGKGLRRRGPHGRHVSGRADRPRVSEDPPVVQRL